MYINKHFGILKVKVVISFLVMSDTSVIYVSFYQVPLVFVKSYLILRDISPPFFLITIQTVDSVNTSIRFHKAIILYIYLRRNELNLTECA